jgi:hypothetical protein
MSAFSEKEGWNDVVPVPQDESPNSVVRIAYSDECKFISVFCFVFKPSCSF